MKNKIKMTIFGIFAFLLINKPDVVSGSFLNPLTLVYEKDIPIVMYHNISNNKSSMGKFVISPDEFEHDLAYLKENGYESIFMADLIGFVHEGKSLPEKPIILTFDDGSFSIDKYAYPLLEKYDMKAVVSVIGKITDDYSSQDRDDIEYYPNLTWEQINKLADSGYVEIQNHTYHLHKGNGVKKLRGESEDAYKKRITEDISKLQDIMSQQTHITANTFTYPFGAFSSSSDDIIKSMGFSASLTCNEKVNTVTLGEKDSLFGLGRILRPHKVSSQEFFAKFDI